MNDSNTRKWREYLDPKRPQRENWVAISDDAAILRKVKSSLPRDSKIVLTTILIGDLDCKALLRKREVSEEADDKIGDKIIHKKGEEAGFNNADYLCTSLKEISDRICTMDPLPRTLVIDQDLKSDPIVKEGKQRWKLDTPVSVAPASEYITTLMAHHFRRKVPIFMAAEKRGELSEKQQEEADRTNIIPISKKDLDKPLGQFTGSVLRPGDSKRAR